MIKCLPIIYTILLSSIKASLFLLFYLLLAKLNINSNPSDINSIYILNSLIILILSFKIYIGYLNYKSIFYNIFDIYNSTKKFYILYCTIINYTHVEEDIYPSECNIHDNTQVYNHHNHSNQSNQSNHSNHSNHSNQSNHINYESRELSYLGESYDDEAYEDDISYLGDSLNDLNISKIKKNNLLYIKEILIIYISHTIYIYTEILSNSLFFREYKKINSFIFNEIQKDHFAFNYNSKELHSSYIELLILKNLVNLKNKNYITSSDYSILYKSFSNLQELISKLQTLSFSNNKISYINYIMDCILVLNLINIVLYYSQVFNQENRYFCGVVIFIISFILYFINDVSNIFINIFKNLNDLFDCENYIFNLNDELFLLNYFYLNNIEYKI